MLFQTLKIEKKGRLEYYTCGNIRQSKQGRSSLDMQKCSCVHIENQAKKKKPNLFFFLIETLFRQFKGT